MRLDAVGYRRSTKEQKGGEKEREVMVEAQAEAVEEEKDPNIRVPSYKQGG